MKKIRGFTLIEVLVGTIIIAIVSITLTKILSSFNTLNDKMIAKNLMITQQKQIKNYFEWEIIENKLSQEVKNMEIVEDLSNFKNNKNNFLNFWTQKNIPFVYNKNGTSSISLNDIGSNYRYFRLNTKGGKAILQEMNDENDVHYLGRRLSLFGNKLFLKQIEEERDGVIYKIGLKNTPIKSEINGNQINSLTLKILTDYKLGEGNELVSEYVYSPLDF